MTRKKAELLRLSLAVSLTALWSPVAQAQAQAQPGADTAVIDDIIVTARRTEERLQDVPISIIAISGEDLDRKVIRNLNDLPSVSPGLSVQNTAVNRLNPAFSIRGQGQGFGQVTPGVVAYFSEVPDFSNAFFDLQSVQVLKGPQGTLFGRNTNGGAILFVPRKPTNEFDASMLVRIGNYQRRDLEFALGGAVVEDKVLVRVAGQYLKRDGFTRNLTTGRKNDDEDQISLRGSLVLAPTDWLENYTIGAYNRIDQNGTGVIFGEVRNNPNVAAVFPAMQAALARQQALGIRTIADNGDGYTDLHSQGLINRTTAQVGDHITLKNIFSYRRNSGSFANDLDGTTLLLLQLMNPSRSRVLTNETQAQATFVIIEVTGGYYYEHTNIPLGLFFDSTQLIAGSPLRVIQETASTGKDSAFYGEATVKPVDGMALTAGIRRSRSQSSGRSQQFLVFPGNVRFPTGPVSTTGGKFAGTNWNFAASYEFSPNLNVYGTARRGFRPGGSNLTAPSAEFFSYAPETVQDYEIGVKSQFAMGEWHGRFNVAAFHDKYKNIQRNVIVTLPGKPAATITNNAADATIKGFDLETTIDSPSRIFQLTVGYSYLKAHYGRYDGGTLGDLSDMLFQNAPKHQLTITPRVELPVPDGIGKISALANVYYIAKRTTDAINRDIRGGAFPRIIEPAALLDAYTKLDLRLDWSGIMGGPISAGLFAKNVTKTVYKTGTNNQISGTFGFQSAIYGEPRTYGLELRADF
ncbi:MAG: hypothetical protein JWR77_2196 [Rhizorhabdus sp.]|nr:hypothetical protein [Rhizorhabdus sp.]